MNEYIHNNNNNNNNKRLHGIMVIKFGILNWYLN